MSFMTFLVSTAVTLYLWALLMRVWMQWVRSDYYNPFSQMIVKITHPVVKPLRRVIPALGSIDTASIVLAYLLATLKLPIFLYVSGYPPSFSANILLYLFLGLATLLKTAGTMLFWVLIIRAIMSWISQGRGAVDHLLYQLTEPLMAPIRRIVPTFGGLDLSVMILLFALTGLNYLGYDIMDFFTNNVGRNLWSLL